MQNEDKSAAGERRQVHVGRLRELFHLLKDVPVGEHEALLCSVGATDQEKKSVEALLRASERQSSVFRTPVLDWIGRFENLSFSETQLHGREVGNFRIEEVIGRGGSAIVLRARRTDGSRRVAAVKLIHKGLYSPDAQRRFEREAAILAQLKHRSVATLLDFGFTAWGMPYLALEYVEGTDIVAYANLHALTQRQRIAALVQVCEGLHAAHAQRIVHRDIKPANILVTLAGEVKLVDFGLGKLLDEESSTATVEVALTPSYAAPEQYEPGALRPSADVYSLGVLASELLLGVRLGPDCAWPSEPVGEVARERWRQMPAALKQILSVALNSRPQSRYRSAGELGCALNAHLSDHRQPFLQKSRTAIARLAHRMDQRLGAIAVPAAMFFLGISLSLLWTSQTQSHRPTPAHYSYPRHPREIGRLQDSASSRSAAARTTDVSAVNFSVLCNEGVVMADRGDASIARLQIPLLDATPFAAAVADCTARAMTPLGSAQKISPIVKANAHS